MPSKLQENLGNDIAASKRRLDIHIKNNKDMKLRPADADLDKTAEAMAKMAVELSKMGCPREVARDLSLLWLYDIAILLGSLHSSPLIERYSIIRSLS